jgi:hypothetical protein
VIQNKTEFLGIRLEPDMAKAIEARAAENRMTASDWARETLARALTFSPDLHILLRELCATRLEFRHMLHEQLQYGKLAADRFQYLMRQASEAKENYTQKVIAEGRAAARKLPPDSFEEPEMELKEPEMELEEQPDAEPEKPPISRRSEEARALAAMRRR